MMIDRTIPDNGATGSGISGPRPEIQRLRQTIRVLEDERKRLMEKEALAVVHDRRGVLATDSHFVDDVLGAGESWRARHGDQGAVGATYEMAILNETELTELGAIQVR